MKKTVCITKTVLLISFLVLFAGCSVVTGKNSAPVGQSAAPAEFGTAGIANPLVEKDSAQQIEEETGAYLKVPGGATDVKYYVIAQKVGQIKFSFQGKEFTLRGAKELSGTELHGVYGEALDGTVAVTIPEGSFEIYTYPEGGRLVTWAGPEINFSLYASTGAGDDTIATVLESVAAD